MSTPPGKTAARPRASFAAASFGNLRAAAGEGQGEALRILLADIDEDPGQPRTVFDDEDLQGMAESIRAHGVVQPVVVRPAVGGRYRLVFGARRLRASRLAGVADIPAVIRSAGTDSFAVQVIENQQRAGLSNSDLAAAVAKLSGEGLTNKQIAAICSMKDYQVAAFRQAGNFPPELAARTDTADIRALYDLFRQWGKTPAEVIAALPGADTFISVTEARRIIGEITGRATGSIVLDRARGAAPAHPEDCSEAPDGTPRVAARPSPAQASAPASGPSQAPDVRPKAPPEPRLAKVTQAEGAPIFIVAAGDGQPGRLVVDRRAERQGWALVAYPTGVEEVDAAQLRIVRIE